MNNRGLSPIITFGAGGFGGSLSGSKQKVDSTYSSVIEQTGIQAGDNGFNINVAGNTHLKGAVIDSSLTAQTAGNNQLTTQTLTTDNIENKGQYTASASNIGLNVNGNANTGVNNPAGGTAGSSLKGGLSGRGVSDSGEASGTTKSAIATANITIIDDKAQQALTGKDATQTVATLNRDTQHANGRISNPYDQQKVAEQLEFLQVASELVIEPLAAQAAKWIGDTFKPDPAHPDQIDPAKVAVHAALGAAMSQLLGTGWQTGAAAGALGDVLPQVLAKAFEKDPVTGKPINEEAFKAANVIISAALTSATGGDLAQTINAGMVTQNAVVNNYLTHQEVKIILDELLVCKTSECVNNLLRQAIILSESRDGKDLTSRTLYEAAHAGTLDLITVALLDPNQSFMVRQAASLLLNINMDDEGVGQQNYSRILAAQLALVPTNGSTIGVTNSNVVSPEKFDKKGQDALAAGLAIGTGTGAMVMAAPLVTFRSSIAASTATNTGINVWNQFNQYGEIKYPTELAINAGFGVLEGYLGRFSGTGLSGIGVEALIGGSSNVATALTASQYYQYDKDHQYNLLWEATKGASMSTAIKGYEERKFVIEFITRKFK